MSEEEALKTRVSGNGYHYTRLAPGKWRLTHHLIAAQTLGRAIDSAVETVRFKDGDRTNLNPDNIEVVRKGNKSFNEVLTRFKREKAELEARLKFVNDRIAALENSQQPISKAS